MSDISVECTIEMHRRVCTLVPFIFSKPLRLLYMYMYVCVYVKGRDDVVLCCMFAYVFFVFLSFLFLLCTVVFYARDCS